MKRRLLLLLILGGLCGSAFGSWAIPASHVARSRAAAVELNADSLRKAWDHASLTRALELYTEAGGVSGASGNRERASLNLRRAAEVNLILGRLPEALESINSALEPRRPSSPSDSALSLAVKATVIMRMGRVDAAYSLARRAMSDCRRTLSSECIPSSLHALGLVEYERYEYRTAIDHMEAALSAWRLLGDAESEARVLLDLSYARMTNGEFELALEYAHGAQAFGVRAGVRQMEVLGSSAVGVMKSKLGAKHEALEIFLALQHQFPDGVNALDKGDMFNHLAKIYSDFDRRDLAEDYHLKALEIYRREGNLSAELALVPKLGMLAYARGDHATGSAYFERGFELARVLRNPFYIAVLNQDLGEVHAISEPERSLRHSQTALLYFTQIGIKQQFPVLQNRLGQLSLQRGRIERAEEYFGQALDSSRETGNRLAETEALYRLAHLSFTKGHTVEAIAQARQAVSLTESFHGELGSVSLRRSYFTSVHERYQFLRDLLMERHQTTFSPDFAREAAIIADQGRSRFLLETLRFSNLEGQDDSNIRKEIESQRIISDTLSKKVNELLAFASTDANLPAVRELNREIERQTQALELHTAALRRKSTYFELASKANGLDIDRFLEQVPTDTVVLQYSLGDRESYVWSYGAAGFATHRLRSRGDIEHSIMKLRGFIDAGVSGTDTPLESRQLQLRENELAYADEARKLSIMLLRPVSDVIRGKRLVIVADGQLQGFPVGALPGADAENDVPLLVTNHVSYSPSVSALQFFVSPSTATAKPRKDLLVFADPVFSETDDRLSGLESSSGGAGSPRRRNFRALQSIERLERLQGSNDEARMISDAVGGFGLSVYSGFSATRDAALTADIGDYKVVHFATHGLIDPHRPELSGLLLSLYNQQGVRIDNGFIRLHDIYGLQLNSDLVVLSACETGVGKDIRGEGLLSLANGFLQAGSKTVVSSLWKVDDAATKKLMSEFYRGMADEGLTVSAALRQAQIKMYNDPLYRLPFYWAAFTMHGDYDRMPQISSRYRRYSSLVAVACLLLVGFFFWKLRGALGRAEAM